MIRPIKLTEELIAECVEEFRKSITASRMYSGNLKYEKTFRWSGKLPPAQIVFSLPAYMKMVKLIDHFSSEVAWHCTVKRDEEHPEIFHVQDVFVSPQQVTGTTVNSDQAEYDQWLCQLPDEVFNDLKMQCHSHVNMACSPSGTDREHWSGVLNALVEEGDVFYIFMIWNKSLKYTAQVYDLTNNTYYDDGDVKVSIDNLGVDLAGFIEAAKAAVKPKTYTAPGFSGSQSGSGTKPADTEKGGALAPVTPLGQKAKEAWNNAEAERGKELEKRKAEKNGKGYDPGYDDRKDYPPRYGASYGSNRQTGMGTGFYDRSSYYDDDGYYCDKYGRYVFD